MINLKSGVKNLESALAYRNYRISERERKESKQSLREKRSKSRSSSKGTKKEPLISVEPITFTITHNTDFTMESYRFL